MGNSVEGHGLIKFIESKAFLSFPSKKTGKKKRFGSMLSLFKIHCKCMYVCILRIETFIYRTELICSVSQFLHSYICERLIYFQDRSAYSAAGKYVDRSWEYMYKSLTDT
jgi:hypothetical protein